jgi:hypothetical protein
MGFKTEFNWGLKLKPDQGLDESIIKEGKEFEFTKDEYRVYPIDQPIDLINRDWVPLARVVVTEVRNANKKTFGKYKVVKIYKGTEKEVLTNYWHEIVEIKKGKKIDDFRDVKVT